MDRLNQKLETSVASLLVWVEGHDYKAYDPGDGQLSFLRAFTFNQLRLEQFLTAGVLRIPFHIRPLLGIRPHTSTKGMGYMAWGYLRMFKATGDPSYAERARFCLDWLIKHRAPAWKQFCWGNEFTFTTRAGRIPAHEPTIVWSGLIGQSFLDGYKTFGEERYLEIASSTCDWILTLPQEKTKTGVCLSYVPSKQSSIHNSNMLGAALLGRVGSLTGRKDALELAREAMLYSCSRINPDGSWFYGEHPKYHWIDNFHTGYNLDSLKRYSDSTGNDEFAAQMRDGFAYFKKSFTEPDGRPRYYHDRIFPTDIQCAAQAVDTFSFFSEDDPESLSLACKIANWTIDNMQDRDGYFYYRDLGWKKIKTPMFHWGQGTTFKALSHLLSILSDSVASHTDARNQSETVST